MLYCPIMMIINLILLLQFFALDSNAKPNKKIVLSWDTILSCPDYENKFIDISKASMYMINETTIQLKGDIEIKENLDKPIKVNALVERNLGNDNFMALMNYNVELCEKLSTKNDWSPYLNALEPKLPKTCPIPKNKYDVSKVQPQSNSLDFKKDMIGSYRSTIKMDRVEKNDGGIPGPSTMWGCYQLNFNIDYAE